MSKCLSTMWSGLPGQGYPTGSLGLSRIYLSQSLEGHPLEGLQLEGHQLEGYQLEGWVLPRDLPKLVTTG